MVIEVVKSCSSTNFTNEFLKLVEFSTSNIALGNCLSLNQITSMYLADCMIPSKVKFGYPFGYLFHLIF